MASATAQRILISGGAGYVGSALTRLLLAKGYAVRVVDVLRSGGEAILGLLGTAGFEFHKVDVRDASAMSEMVQGCYGVAHLAAIVGDPACKAEPDLARSTNLEASQRLYEIADQAGCQRFVFISTCSNYGKMADQNEALTEDAPLAPLSLYAETKVACEKFLLSQPPSRTCKPTCLRFATAYGISQRMRFDLTVNEFVKELQLGRKLVVYGEQFWRPYADVRDLARAVCRTLQCDAGLVAGKVFNVGDSSENYTKQMLVDEITRHLPNANIEYVQQADDPRDYRVNCDKIKKELNFEVSRRVPQGIEELLNVLKAGMLINPDDPKYSNT